MYVFAVFLHGLYAGVCMDVYRDVLELGGCEGPKAGNALQEVCVHEVGTVVALFGLAAGIIYIVFFCFWGAGLVLGREPPRVCLDVCGRGCLDAPHTPQLLSPEGWPYRYICVYVYISIIGFSGGVYVRIGVCMYIYIYVCQYVYTYRCVFIHVCMPVCGQIYIYACPSSSIFPSRFLFF